MILEQRGVLGTVDPRIKLVWLLATLVAGLVFIEFLSLLIIIASIAAVAAAAGVLGETVRRMKALAMIMIVIGLIFGLTVPGTPFAALGPISLSQEGLWLGLVSVLRILVFSSPVVVIIMTTNNSDLIQALMALRLPMEYALMIVLALNFVPLYLEEFGRIADAQKARAHALVEQGLIGKLRGLVPIFVPLTLNAIDRADTVGKVLEIRGFARRQFRPEFETPNTPSWILLAISCLIGAVALISLAAGRDIIAAALM